MNLAASRIVSNWKIVTGNASEFNELRIASSGVLKPSPRWLLASTTSRDRTFKNPNPLEDCWRTYGPNPGEDCGRTYGLYPGLPVNATKYLFGMMSGDK